VLDSRSILKRISSSLEFVVILLSGLLILGCARRANPAPAPQMPVLEYAASWGVRGISPGQLESPVGIAADGFGNVYVADAAMHSVDKFSSDGMPLLTFGDIRLTRPEGIAVDRGGGIYVSVEERVLVFWPEGDFLRATHGVHGAALREASGIAVSDSGDFYVVDRAACRVEAFDWRGRFLHAWGKCGTENGEFVTPSGVAVNHEGNVFIADSAGSRVQEFSPEGTFLGAFGQATTTAATDPPNGARARTGAAAVAVSTKNIFSAGEGTTPLRVWSFDGREIALDPAILEAAHLTPDFRVAALTYDLHTGDLLVLNAQDCRVLRVHVHF